MATLTSAILLGGIDLGGTKILAAAASADGEILSSDLRPTDPEQGPDAVLNRMIESLREALRQARAEPQALRAIGVAAPGPLDQARGIVCEPPNLPGWHDVPVSDRLWAAFHVPVYLENDANAAALAEHMYGAGRGSRHMVYLTLSTGIGAGLIIDGRLYRGASGVAGELGHLVIEANGPPCGCGSRGCLEALASGTAIGREGAKLVAQGRAPVLAELAQGGEVTAQLVAEAALAGDAGAAGVIAAAARYLGLGLTSIVNAFNPEVIVVGGGVAKIGESLLAPAVQVMRATAFAQAVRVVTVRPAALGDEVAVRGALALVRRHTER